jgi:hypothetical protein
MKEVEDTESQKVKYMAHMSFFFFFFFLQLNPFKTNCKLFYLMTQFMLHS